MKTQVIQLFIHDDMISIRDRMGWAKTPRILLIWPRRGKVGVRPLDLTLLRRHAESLGAELGLVTRNSEIRTVARALNISVFSDAKNAQKKRWLERRSSHPARRFPRVDLRTVRRNLPSIDLFTFGANPIRRVLIFAIGVLAVLAVVLVFVPSAEIQITLPDQNQILTIPVSSEPEIESVQISGVVPQRSLTLSVDGQDTVLASGIAILPDKTARGEVLLMNLSEAAIRVPPGTVLLTRADPPIPFVTTKRADVLPGKGSTIRVPVLAVAPGVSGNVGTGSITLLESPQGLQLAVTNPEPTSGGTQSEVVLATDQDRGNLRKRLLSELSRQAQTRFSDQISSGDVMFPATFAQTRVLSEIFDPPDGKPGEKLTLSLRVEYKMAYSAYTDLHLLAERVLNASLPAGYMATSQQIDLKTVSAFTQTQDVVYWHMRIERKMRPVLAASRVISIVLGKSVKNAGEELTTTFGLVQSPQISILPGWWPWLPSLPIRIVVKG